MVSRAKRKKSHRVKKVKVSVVTPSFNQAGFIIKTIKSVLSQKGDFELEYIVMDGGSTDGTVDILKKYGKKINWVSKKDKGQSDAINKGWRKATGDIVAYLNSDDMYERGAIQSVVSFFRNNPDIDWTYGKCKIVDEKGKEIRKWIKWYRHLLGQKYSYNKLLTENFVAQPSVFFRRKILNDCGYLDAKQHLIMDYEYWLRIGQKHKGSFINKPIAKFRFYRTSKSGSMFVKQFRDELKTAKKYARGKKWPVFVHTLNFYKIILIYKILELIKR
jgi:glycosyltransferase involved in cell wall biosynthesis